MVKILPNELVESLSEMFRDGQAKTIDRWVRHTLSTKKGELKDFAHFMQDFAHFMQDFAHLPLTIPVVTRVRGRLIMS